MYRILFLICFSMLLSSCAIGTGAPNSSKEGGMRHASWMEMEETDSFTCVRVKNPWHTKQFLATYILVAKDHKMPAKHPDGIIIRTPVKRAVMGSAVHVALAAELQCEKQVAGLMDAEYVVSPEVKALIGNGAGSIHPMGASMQPDVELIRSAQADALLLSPFDNAGHGPLSHLNVPIIECADYMETSPLGRAEWMRFYGRLFGQKQKADSLFAEVEKAYESCTEEVARSKSKRPTVFCDVQTGSTWYEPGGESTMGRLLEDAGARYLWADRKESGSIPLDMESVFAKGREADIWLVKYGAATDWTYASMKADNARYALFLPWKKKHIWGCNTLHNPFYEETPFHPERLLKNLIGIFHPDLHLKKTGKVYYTPME